jgi:hypothetical protein
MGLQSTQSSRKQCRLDWTHSRYHPRHFAVRDFSDRFAEGVPHFVRLVAIAVPSIANESATGVLVLARWSVAGADVVFARSNAYSTN